MLVAEDDGGQLESVDDLSELAVGARPSTWGMTQVERLLAEDTISEEQINQYDTYTQAVQALENGTVDAVVIDSLTAETVEGTRPVTIAFMIEADVSFHFKMREDDDRINAINDAITEVMEDGTYQDITREWFRPDV